MRTSNRGTRLKSGYFTAIGSCSVKTVVKTAVDRYRRAACHNKHW